MNIQYCKNLNFKRLLKIKLTFVVEKLLISDFSNVTIRLIFLPEKILMLKNKELILLHVFMLFIRLPIYIYSVYWQKTNTQSIHLSVRSESKILYVMHSIFFNVLGNQYYEGILKFFLQIGF